MAGKKVLILHSSVGLGHKSIAENIGFYLQAAGYEVKIHNAHKTQSVKLVGISAGIYNWMVERAPFVWSWLYNTGWFISATLPLRDAAAGLNYKNILEVINNFQPDAVVSTHTTTSAVLDYLKAKKLYNKKFGIAFSDFHLHRYWLYPRADFYLANTEDQKREMAQLGINPAKIFVCGVTLKPKAAVDVAAIKNQLSIKEGEKVALISSGSMGTGLDADFIDALASQTGTKLVIVCGKNERARQNLEKKFSGRENVAVLGYYSPMDNLYAIADIFITKPGGLSTAEALFWRLPLLVYYHLPGQEEHNYSYLLQKKLIMPKSGNIAAQAEHELRTGAFKQSLAANPEAGRIFNNGQAVVEAVSKRLA